MIGIYIVVAPSSGDKEDEQRGTEGNVCVAGVIQRGRSGYGISGSMYEEA